MMTLQGVTCQEPIRLHLIQQPLFEGICCWRSSGELQKKKKEGKKKQKGKGTDRGGTPTSKFKLLKYQNLPCSYNMPPISPHLSPVSPIFPPFSPLHITSPPSHLTTPKKRFWTFLTVIPPFVHTKKKMLQISPIFPKLSQFPNCSPARFQNGRIWTHKHLCHKNVTLSNLRFSVTIGNTAVISFHSMGVQTTGLACNEFCAQVLIGLHTASMKWATSLSVACPHWET